METAVFLDLFKKGSDKLASYTKHVHITAYALVWISLLLLSVAMPWGVKTAFQIGLGINVFLFLFLWLVPSRFIRKKREEGKNWKPLAALLNICVARIVIFPALIFSLWLTGMVAYGFSLAKSETSSFDKKIIFQGSDKQASSLNLEVQAQPENTKEKGSDFEKTKALAETGDAEAQFQLAKCFDYGRGTSINKEEALGWYAKSANQGFAKAAYAVGWIFHHGDGVKKNGEKAIYWYTKAADLGDTSSMYNMANAYKNGDGVKKNGEKAIYWYTKAADLGDAEAMFNLGIIYRDGEGVLKDPSKALKWFKKGAEKGDAEAQAHVGIQYFYGWGTERDPLEAAKWTHIAVLSGFKFPRKLRKNMLEGFSEKDIRDGMRKAGVWHLRRKYAKKQ